MAGLTAISIVELSVCTGWRPLRVTETAEKHVNVRGIIPAGLILAGLNLKVSLRLITRKSLLLLFVEK